MSKGATVHMKSIGPVGYPVCGTWSRSLTDKPQEVTCLRCLGSHDWTMVGERQRRHEASRPAHEAAS